jgi:hypothetical protein
MRQSIFRRFIGGFWAHKNSMRCGSRRNVALRRLTFECCEAREMFSAADIFAENMLTGATGWQVRSPVQDVVNPDTGQIITPGERPRAVWNRLERLHRFDAECGRPHSRIHDADELRSCGAKPRNRL